MKFINSWKILSFLFAIIFVVNNAEAAVDYYRNIPVNQPISLNYKTKAEVYKIRKTVVNESIFKNSNYVPSEEVFGGIEDGKPWKSMRNCVIDNGKVDIYGASEESRFILNPSALIVLEVGAHYYCKNNSTLIHDLMTEIKYNEAKKEIIVVYDKLNFNYPNALYKFNAVNARDLGYEFFFVDKYKSTYDLVFKQEQYNASTAIFQPNNFIHLGSSCGHESGCNNGSPHQPEVIIKHPYNKRLKNEPKEIYIKLWKEMPNSPQDTPDMVERIIINNT